MSLSLPIGCKDHDTFFSWRGLCEVLQKKYESDKYSLTDSKQEAILYLPRSSSPCVVRSRQQGKLRPKGGEIMNNQLTENEYLFYLAHGFDEVNLMEDEMYFEIKQWANETIMCSLGLEGFLEQKEFYGVE